MSVGGLMGSGEWNPVADFGRVAPPGADEAQLWLLPLDEPRWPLDAVAACLSDEERARAERFRFERDRRAFIVSHGLTRRLLGACIGRPPAAVALANAPGGKPALADAAGLQFNLSHSAGWALVGLAASDIGVDVEVVRPIADRAAIAGRHFTAGEAKALQALPDSEREDGFFACWTRKEAYVKALGLGLSAPLDGFDVSLDPRAPAALLAVGGDREAARRWSLCGGRPAPGVWTAAALPRPGVSFRLFRLGQGGTEAG